MANSKPELPDTVMILRNVTLLWPSLFEKAVIDGNETGKYSVKCLLDPEKDKDQIAQITEHMKTVAGAVFEDDDLSACKNLALRKSSFKDEAEILPKGALEIMCSNKGKPFVVDADGSSQIGIEEKDRFYNGVKANVKIDFWGIENKWGRTVSANLHAVQFDSNGTRLTGGGMSYEKAVEGFAAIDVGDLEEMHDDGDDLGFLGN